jgi:hypothetical protein
MHLVVFPPPLRGRVGWGVLRLDGGVDCDTRKSILRSPAGPS